MPRLHRYATALLAITTRLLLVAAESPALPDPASLDPSLLFPSAGAQPAAAASIIPAFPEQSEAAAATSICQLAPSPQLLPAVLASCNADGFFLHSPFPSSEIFRTIPVREDLVRALLNADLVGFHTFDYARHFLSSCSRLLGLDYQSKRGYIGIEYYSRTVTVKILPVGIDMDQLRSVVAAPETADVARRVAEAYKGQRLMVGVDDVDLFKGIGLKFLAMEQLLLDHPELRGRAVLVQIANPARSEGRDVQGVQDEARTISAQVMAACGLICRMWAS